MDNHMPRISTLLTVSVVVLGLMGPSAIAADPADRYPGLNLIPWPKAVRVGEGRVELHAKSRIMTDQEELKPLANVLSGEIALRTRCLQGSAKVLLSETRVRAIRLLDKSKQIDLSQK